MMNNSLFAALFILPVSISSICQADSLKRRFVIEFQQDGAGSPIQSVSIKHNLNTLSYNPSDIADTNGYAGLDLPPDDKPHGINGYGLKTTLIESISWPLIYASHLLVAYEMILITHDTSLSAKPFSWLPVEAFVVIGWLLKNDWNSDSSLFIPIDQPEASQDDPFAITTMMLPGNSQQKNDHQNPPSTSSSQQATGGATSTRTTGYASGSPSSGSGDDDKNPEPHQHTFDYNCHFGSCHGVCKLRSSSVGGGSARRPRNSLASSASLITLATLAQSIHPPSAVPIGQPEPASKTCKSGVTDPTGPFVCEVLLKVKSGERLCGKRLRDREMLSNHRMQYHTAPRFCDVIVVGGNGEQRVCGAVFNILKQQRHNRRYHEGEENIRWSDPDRSDQDIGSVFCDVIAYVQNYEERIQVTSRQLCGRIFETSERLRRHRRSCHQGRHSRWKDIRRPPVE
ncbi:hypothetical protein [Endozoicomonas sp. 8E]|uniref:hypothetical protein n=1 Tax=Endozoicomonas sp. 8E TaxID=3035692 RepID=UPI0029392F4D|nr:hypothetical protein [Endozoicomonas sp. 8E]WOG27288.1 hypothetical protein P6910_22500 [Endozoicomonas sp. 8E]